jgi:hypothetical protein
MASPREVLIEALKDVDEADVPEDLREIAFSKAFDLRAGTVVPAVQNQPPGALAGAHGTPSGHAPATPTPPTDDPLDNIAARLKVDNATVAEVFTVHNDELELIISPTRLPEKIATGSKEVALLIAGGRQAAAIEEWTLTDVIRQACVDYKKYDQANFAKTMRQMGDVFNFRKDDGKSLVRLAKPGWERLEATVKRLGGE